MLILQGQFIGIEFEGMHYYMESNKQGENWSRHKDKILRAYGVHIVKMKSSDFLVRSYNQLNDSDSAAKLIIEVIDQAMKELLEREK